ncbi:MAG: UDP-glucose/GDP-mannose dehydrogenase family protein [Candidatus Taylorbacteria bacterium]|nr:UDP-glucose/GDP-mannose dehydrogenase family protein [Candidatus Taylorbacteria bacterium]
MKKGEKETKTENARRPLIGFIGQGWIGKNYADDFEKRGFTGVRYAMEEPYRKNKEKIKACDVVFIAVPTPTTPGGFDYSIIEKVLPLIGKGKVAVVKSTMLPGTTEKLQKLFPDIFVFHSPEFLREKTASYDAAHPDRNIIGIPIENEETREAAKKVLSVLPKAPYEAVIRSTEAELVKYGGNNFFYVKVVYINMLYDLAQKLGCRWEHVRDALTADPRIGASHMDPVHKSGHAGEKDAGGRGAGGHCFIKDFAAFVLLYEKLVADPLGKQVLESLTEKNNELLRSSGKDLDLLEGVHGTNAKRS